MSFSVKAGKVKTIWLPVDASGGAMPRGSLVTVTSGVLELVTSSTANTAIVGILDKAVATTDADYAVARLLPVIVPVEKHVEYEADVTSGLVATDVGLEVDATDHLALNRGASSVDVAKCVKVLSATKGIFWLKINGSY
jgi:hypothetical protein